jgi:hypothetical protein
VGFKEDADFARYLTMGAHGTVGVATDLNGRGHRIIELERYATANKVWSIKVKRLRVPDLLCVRCGRRFESKAKSKLEIKLSHSATPGREWYAGGMRPTDVFAFIKVAIAGNDVESGRPYYFTRAALDAAFAGVKTGTRKAISAGSEADISWPAWAPSYNGRYLGTKADDSRTFLVANSSGGTRKYCAPENWGDAYAYMTVNDEFTGTFDLVAGSVSPADVKCDGDDWDWSRDLTSPEQADRFAAVKSYGARPHNVTSSAALSAIADDEDEDWRVRLEAQGALAIHDPTSWIPKIEARAADTTMPPEQQMEAVFVLSELTSPLATAALERTARAEVNRLSEVRSAAVWGVGRGAARSPKSVMTFVYDDDDRVALHAASVLPRALPGTIVTELKSWLASGSERQSAVAAKLLARHGEFGALLEMSRMGSSRGHLYAARALGETEKSVVERALGDRLDAQTIESFEPMWTQHTDWLCRTENQGALDILDAQQVQHELPANDSTDGK